MSSDWWPAVVSGVLAAGLRLANRRLDSVSSTSSPSSSRPSILASLGGAALTILGAGGLPGIAPLPALTALVVSALVGYLTIDALMRVVERVPFWAV